MENIFGKLSKRVPTFLQDNEKSYDPVGGVLAGLYTMGSGKLPENKNDQMLNRLLTASYVKQLTADPTDVSLDRRVKESLIGQREAKTEGTMMSPSRQNAKDKRTEELLGLLETNKARRGQLAKASDSMKRVPTGLGGKMQIELMKRTNPNDPLLTDWQNIKSILTDVQLMNVAKTKGAISDREMELFAQAAANDDLMSIARMKPALDRLSNSINAQEDAAIGSYRRIYDEDPTQWPEVQEAISFRSSQPNMPSTSRIQSSDDTSEEDMMFTMQKYGLSREEVLKRLGQ